MYNETFVSEYKEEIYLNFLRNKNVLESFKNFEHDRYIQGKRDGENYLLKESLDHYVIKKLKLDPNFENAIEFKNYIDYLVSLSICNYDVNTNMFYSAFKNEDYVRWFGDKINYIAKIKGNNNQFFDSCFNKLKKGDLLTQNELNALCCYFSKKRLYNYKEYRDNYSMLMTYLFSIVKDNNQYQFSQQIFDAILNYVPIQYKNWLRNRDNFNPYNIRLYAGNYLINPETKKLEETNVKGLSFGNRIFINSSFIKTSFSSIDDSFEPYKKEGEDFTFLMIVLFHEMTHNYQSYMSKENKASDTGLSYAICSILRKHLNDYKENHDNDDMEINATSTGWQICSDFYRKHISVDSQQKDILLKNCKKNSCYTIDRRPFAIKKGNNGLLYFKDDYDISNLTRIIQTNPDYLKIYPCLKRLYKENGELNSDVCFDLNEYGKGYIEKSFILYNLYKNKNILLSKINQEKYKTKILDFICNVRDALSSQINAYKDNYKGNKMGEYVQKTNFSTTRNYVAKRVLSYFNNYKDLFLRIPINSFDIPLQNRFKTEFEFLSKDVAEIEFDYKYNSLLESNNDNQILDFLEQEVNQNNKYHTAFYREIEILKLYREKTIEIDIHNNDHRLK